MVTDIVFYTSEYLLSTEAAEKNIPTGHAVADPYANIVDRFAGAARKLSARQKHAAQSIKAMWMKKGEAMDPDAHTYNRYFLLQQKLTQSDGIAWPA